jgi:hypothetical protein
MPQPGAAKPPAGAFFDSGFASIDSLLAVALLHGLQTKGSCRLEIVTMSRPNLAIAGFLDAVERYYRGPAGNFSQVPPIGMSTVGAAGETPPAFVAPFARKRPDGSAVYRNEVKTAIDTGDPSTLIRNYLQAQHDRNAFFVLDGPATNLAAALEFPETKEWIAAKVKHLVMAGGTFPSGPAEARWTADLPAMRKVLAEWPTPIVACGREIGAALLFPGASADGEEVPADHPVVDAYRAAQPMPYDTPSCAMAAALYAARPNEGYFQLSAAGRIGVDGGGRTSFQADEKGGHRYLLLDPAQKEKIIQAYTQLALAGRAPRGRRPKE